MQPGARRIPVADDGAYRHAERFSGFLDGEPAKESQLDHLLVAPATSGDGERGWDCAVRTRAHFRWLRSAPHAARLTRAGTMMRGSTPGKLATGFATVGRTIGMSFQSCGARSSGFRPWCAIAVALSAPPRLLRNRGGRDRGEFQGLGSPRSTPAATRSHRRSLPRSLSRRRRPQARALESLEPVQSRIAPSGRWIPPVQVSPVEPVNSGRPQEGKLQPHGERVAIVTPTAASCGRVAMAARS